jgi:hypothetical protein
MFCQLFIEDCPILQCALCLTLWRLRVCPQSKQSGRAQESLRPKTEQVKSNTKLQKLVDLCIDLAPLGPLGFLLLCGCFFRLIHELHLLFNF